MYLYFLCFRHTRKCSHSCIFKRPLTYPDIPDAFLSFIREAKDKGATVAETPVNGDVNKATQFKRALFSRKASFPGSSKDSESEHCLSAISNTALSCRELAKSSYCFVIFYATKESPCHSFPRYLFNCCSTHSPVCLCVERGRAAIDSTPRGKQCSE